LVFDPLRGEALVGGVVAARRVLAAEVALCRCSIWTYPPKVSVSPDDPDFDAWEAASQTTPEELARAASLGEIAAQLWKGRLVEDTRPLEAYEPPEA
jgi:hypothetical protein